MSTSYGLKHLAGAMVLGILVYGALILVGQLFIQAVGGAYPGDSTLLGMGWNLLVGTALVCGTLSVLAIIGRGILLITRALRPSDAQQVRSA